MPFENIRTVLGISNGAIRSAVKGALIAKGFRHVTDAPEMINLHNAIEEDRVDLIITLSKLGFDDTTLLLREMRYNRIGHNPFIATIMLLESPDKDELGRVVNAGVDDVLLMPISPSQLLTRIETVKRQRKPFVMTYDYIGPDRRKEERPGTAKALTFVPPNPLELRQSELFDSKRFEHAIENGLTFYLQGLFGVQSRQLEWLAGQVAMGCRDTNIAVKDTMAHAARMINLIQDLGKRLKSERYAKQLDLATSLLPDIRHIGSDPRAAPLELLSKVVNKVKDLKQQLTLVE